RRQAASTAISAVPISAGARMGTWPGRHVSGRSSFRRTSRRLYHCAPPPGKRGPMPTTGPGHLPVMTDRVLALLAPALQQQGSVLVDATLGRAGHAGALLSRHPGLTLIGVDTDDAAIEESRQRLAPYAERVSLVHAR